MSKSAPFDTTLETDNLVASNDAKANAELEDSKHVRFVNLHKHLHVLKVIDMLFELVKVTQQHRAISLALLGGFKSYVGKVEKIEAQTNKLIGLIDLERSQFETLIDDNEWHTIINEWRTVKHQWRQDDALHNFEIHTHLVDRLLTLIWTIFCRSKSTTLIDGELASFEMFILKDLPKLVEILGQIRGISTYTSAIGKCETKYHMRLNFLVNEANSQRAGIEEKLGDFQALWKDQFLSNNIIETVQQHTDELLSTIKAQHLSDGEINISADEMYEMATRVLNIYLLYAEASLKIFKKHSSSE